MARWLGDGHDPRIEVAHEEALALRRTMLAAKRTAAEPGTAFAEVRLSPALEPVQVSGWRVEGMLIAQRELSSASPYAEWLGGRLDLAAMLRVESSWRSFWCVEATEQMMPRWWLRFAMRLRQGTRKVTHGTPADNQLATYLLDCDLLVTADKALADLATLVRAGAPVPMAAARVVPAGRAAVDAVVSLIGDCRRRAGDERAGADE